ncbi:microfibril-associated glycoprotein 4-like [Styela clava]
MEITFTVVVVLLTFTMSISRTDGICVHKWKNGRFVSEGFCEDPDEEEIVSHLKLRAASAKRRDKGSYCDKLFQRDAKIWNGTGGVFEGDDIFGKKDVYCDQTTDGGGWLVFQRRMNGLVNFYRDWNDYVNGFGETPSEHWLGLETLHQLTSSNSYELLIDMEDWEGNKRYARYSNFRVANAASYYTLYVSGYSGNAGDSFCRHNGSNFTTKDRDYDDHVGNCAVLYKGAWWYSACHSSNLNGHYFVGGNHDSYADGVEWSAWKGHYYSLKFTEMKIRIKI